MGVADCTQSLQCMGWQKAQTKRIRTQLPTSTELDIEDGTAVPEDVVIHEDQLRLLRREMSLHHIQLS